MCVYVSGVFVYACVRKRMVYGTMGVVKYVVSS